MLLSIKNMKKTGKSAGPKNIKIIVLGNSRVGKTSMILRYTDDTFTESFTSTLGTELQTDSI